MFKRFPRRLFYSARNIHNAPGQVTDRPELLNQMLEDYRKAEGIYQYTNYWNKKSTQLAAYLKQNGLKDYRRNHADAMAKGSVFRSFGAVDYLPPDFNYKLAVEKAAALGQQTGAVPLAKLPNSQKGNPVGFTVGGAFYCLHWLTAYVRYAYSYQFFDYTNKPVIVEVGPGSGKQAELWKKAHPEATILLFDIVPQIYLCHQYLTTVFPDGVIGYDQTRAFTSHEQIVPGKIHLFANWQLSLVKGLPIDLFWNAASFQEMEPEVVQHYASLVGPSSKQLFLLQQMEGQSQASAPGAHGVLEKTTLAHYQRFFPDHVMRETKQGLSDIRELVTEEQTPWWSYSSTVWNRR